LEVIAVIIGDFVESTRGAGVRLNRGQSKEEHANEKGHESDAAKRQSIRPNFHLQLGVAAAVSSRVIAALALQKSIDVAAAGDGDELEAGL